MERFIDRSSEMETLQSEYERMAVPLWCCMDGGELERVH